MSNTKHFTAKNAAQFNALITKHDSFQGFSVPLHNAVAVALQIAQWNSGK